MKNFFILSCFVILSGGQPIFGQSNAFLDGFLGSDKVSAKDAVYLVFTLGGVIPETESAERAMASLASKNWNLSFKDGSAPITLEEYAYLVMRTYNIGGGVLYTLFPGPRYALRELAYLGYIKGNISPGRVISGNEAFSIARRVIEAREGE